MKKIIKNSNPAFTLAEVLITLGVIGVVSVMTIPGLMQNHQKQVQATQLHKIYSEAHQAFALMLEHSNAVNLSEAGFVRGKESDFFKTYFKTVKDCGYEDTSCFNTAYSSLYNDYDPLTANDNLLLSSSAYKVVGANGASLSLYLYENRNSSTADTLPVGFLTVDTNGLKGPNKCGRDLFSMSVFADGTLDDDGVSPRCRRLGGAENCNGYASAKELRDNNFSDHCATDTDTSGCIGKLINNNWKMEY